MPSEVSELFLWARADIRPFLIGVLYVGIYFHDVRLSLWALLCYGF